MKSSGIYKITNSITNKVYIGQSKNITRRIYQHRRDMRIGNESNKHLQDSYNKYGDVFIFSIVEQCEECDLSLKEIYYINLYKSSDKALGYNILSGGNLPPSWEGKKHKESTKIKMSKAAKGNTTWVGRFHKESSKVLMSKAAIGRKKGGVSKYFGVCPDRGGRWRCNIRINGKQISLGSFLSEHDAALAYDKKVIEINDNRYTKNFEV